MAHRPTEDYSFLDWDSNFFGFKIAIIHREDLNKTRLAGLLATLKSKGVRLVYWPAENKNDLSVDDLKNLNGLLVDQKITFKIRLDTFFLPPEKYDEIERYMPSIPFTNLDSLAKQCGQFSRFAVDPNIPQDKFIELYKLWIKKSLTGEMANEVLIIRRNTFIQGLIALKADESSGCGKITLLVVDKEIRNQSLGKQLVQAGLNWFQKLNLKFARVTTQEANVVACRLYDKCGFFKEKTVKFYHFWV